jgi:hypothetical protein
MAPKVDAMPISVDADANFIVACIGIERWESYGNEEASRSFILHARSRSGSRRIRRDCRQQ